MKWMLFLLVSIFFIPTHQLVSAENQLTVQANTVVNVRENPGLDQTVIGKMEIGKAYPLLKEEKDWIEIQYTSSSTGWVAAYLVTKNGQNTDNGTIETEQSNSISTKATITENGLRLRKGPGTNYQVITTLGKGIEVTVLSTSGDWYQIKTSLGSGWVHNDYLQFGKSESQSSTIEETEDSNLQSATVIEDQVNLRSNPSTNADIIGKISIDTVITIIEEETEWAKIQYSGNIGWVHKDLLESGDIESRKGQKTDKTIKLLYDRTNIRSDATVNSKVLLIADSGATFQTVEVLDDWYKIKLSNGEFGYIAEWIVEDIATESEDANEGNSTDLKGKTIVLDPGHGGKDSGTIGVIGTLEKDLNLRTAKLLANKLEASGANVILTRKDDIFISLQSRVDISHFYHADAFISLHYDSINDSSVNGVTSYYYTSNQKKLATSLHKSIIDATNRKDRGVRKNEYVVLKQNRQAASLLELGYLSNPAEEQTMLSSKYQETISTAIYHGLENYFSY
ncbi:N-acetylmuramoyl-L-alanine amidase [Bacillus sp. T2.9-1]|uniref:N-acetylmuramoyl-L-alanine amidase n=1 Tax=Bacillus sp. T2.9-1 TaxID=3041163 RepID=UPI00253FCB26|nr:N-acetylmuramoyl-L-alanine amidase [Bacillus sp. T2.9-1]